MNKIWMYWEGPLPEWIRLCQESVKKHYSDVVILNDASFAEYGNTFDISSLYVAHKADYIRAYMLHHFGGMWMDSDCVVMKDLTPLVQTCSLWDFIAYKQWSGNYSNALIGAQIGSETAKTFYESVLKVLTRSLNIGWTDIGENCLHIAYDKVDQPRLKLSVDSVSPHCWTDNARFLIKRSDEEHKKNFHQNALCYMMSNHMIKSIKGFKDILDEDTFFSFLLRKSNETGIYTP